MDKAPEPPISSSSAPASPAVAKLATPTGFDQQKLAAAHVSLRANALLTTIKLAGAVLTNSVGLLSEGVHSLTDVVASAVALAAIKAAAVPPDSDHPYGHAKIENISGLAESVLLGLLGVFVIGNGVVHLWQRSPVHQIAWGVALALVSAAVSLAVGLHVRGVGIRTSSPVLKANGLHLMSDFWTTFGVVLALILVHLTGFSWIDGVIGIGLGGWLIRSAIEVGHDAFQQLIDRRLPDEDLLLVRAEIEAETSLISYHRLRTRLSGNLRYLDFHVVVPNTWSVVEAHEVVDRLERRLRSKLSPAVVVIHMDPYDPVKAGVQTKPEAD